MLVVLLGIMERGFQGRHGENQPAVASINTGKLEHIAKKGPVGFGILGIENNMSAIDQRELRLSSVPCMFSLHWQIRNRDSPLKTAR